MARSVNNERGVEADDLDGAALLYCASDDPAEDARAAALARRRRIPVNIVDDLEGSDFITPAIVDRDPVTIAIGTEGTAPVLARSLKAAFEAKLPASLGPLARIGQAFRSKCESPPTGRTRRALWSEYFFRRGPCGYAREGESGAREALRSLLDEAASATRSSGLVSFVGAGPGDPELLTLKARNRLHDADIVVHDRLVSAQMLELARREAERVCAGKHGFRPVVVAGAYQRVAGESCPRREARRSGSSPAIRRCSAGWTKRSRRWRPQAFPGRSFQESPPPPVPPRTWGSRSRGAGATRSFGSSRPATSKVSPSTTGSPSPGPDPSPRSTWASGQPPSCAGAC